MRWCCLWKQCGAVYGSSAVVYGGSAAGFGCGGAVNGGSAPGCLGRRRRSRTTRRAARAAPYARSVPNFS
eukprot:2217743-Rhodomonas_salina.8